METNPKYLTPWVAANQTLVVLLAAATLLYPGYVTVAAINDPALRDGKAIPAMAYAIHRRLAPRYEDWANARIASGRGHDMSVDDIAGTEWPVFGSLFYLLATESLQQAWERDPSAGPEPMSYAAGSVEAATALIVDPSSAGWVRQHWGDDYMTEENAFYRMLVVGSMAIYTELTGDERYLAELREHTETLANDIDASPYGLLEDYPGECYPSDVAKAWWAIQRADRVLGTDHSAMIARGIRGFRGDLLAEPGIPPYLADAKRGMTIPPARGCSSAYICMSAPELWPDDAKQWYDRYADHFWQERHGIAGFREFLPGDEAEWYADVDAGPVIDGFGVSASAFGLAAARINGHHDHGYPLATEMIATSWVLPTGTLLGPRFLSNATDAPYVGEASILYSLTRTPGESLATTPGALVPAYVYVLIFAYVGLGALVIVTAIRTVHATRRHRRTIRAPKFQLACCGACLIAAAACYALGEPAYAAIALVITLIFPRLTKVHVEQDKPIKRKRSHGIASIGAL